MFCGVLFNGSEVNAFVYHLMFTFALNVDFMLLSFSPKDKE